MKKGILIYNRIDAKKNTWFIEYMKQCFLDDGIDLAFLFEEDFNETIMNDIDFLIYRGRNHLTPLQFEQKGIKVFNRSKVNEIANDKYLSYLFFKNHNLPCMDTFSSIDQVNFYPYIMKPVDGHGGENVFLVSNENEAHAIVKEEDRRYVYQKVASDLGKDIRVYMMGNRFYASVLRTAKENEFRSNYSLGGTVEKITPPTEVINLALKVAQNLNSDFIGIDFIHDKNRWVLNEIEDPVGCRMLYKTSSFDAVKDFVSLIESQL